MAGPRDKNNSEASAAGGWQGTDKPRPKTLGGRLVQSLLTGPERPWYDDQKTWDSLTEDERELIKRLEKKNPANRTPSKLGQALKGATDMLPTFKTKPKAPPPAPVSPTWNQFMDKQDAARAGKSITSTIKDEPVKPKRVEGDILMGMSRARRAGDEQKLKTLRQVWEEKQKEERQ